MPKAGAVEPIQFQLTEVDGETPVPGLALGDFTFRAWLNGVVTALTVTALVEAADGYYKVNVAIPNAVGSALRVEPYVTADDTHELDPPVWEGVITANDIDDVAVFAARPPSITLAQNVSPQSAFGITVFKGDGRTIEVPIYDDNGDLLDLNGWTNFRFSIQNNGQTAVSGDLPYDQTTGITGGANGIASIVLPETCSAYDVHPAGHADTKLWWSLDANPTGDTTKTRTLRAGPFTIRSKETPTP